MMYTRKQFNVMCASLAAVLGLPTLARSAIVAPRLHSFLPANFIVKWEEWFDLSNGTTKFQTRLAVIPDNVTIVEPYEQRSFVTYTSTWPKSSNEYVGMTPFLSYDAIGPRDVLYDLLARREIPLRLAMGVPEDMPHHFIPTPANVERIIRSVNLDWEHNKRLQLGAFRLHELDVKRRSRVD